MERMINAQSVHPEGVPIAPFKLHITINNAAMLFDFCAGASMLWEQQQLHAIEGIASKYACLWRDLVAFI